MSIAIDKSVTADELLDMGDIGPCELIYGKVVMMSPAGMEHGAIALRIGRILGDFVERHDLGETFASETGFKLESGPDLVRAPDASFVSKARLGEDISKGFFDGAPDLAVEVISPRDSRADIDAKTKMWLDHGTISVWVCNPADMTVTIHRAGQTPLRLTVADELRDEPSLPGFVMSLSKVFKRP